MNERLVRWNERYGRGEETHDFRPSSPLPSAVSGLPPGRALDLASGAGRHAIWLAERGWQVVAVDGARAGVDIMLAEAARRGVADRIEAHVADLMSRPRGFALEPDGYDLVCDFYFLDRSLFPDIRAAVRPGGLFVAAIHLAGPDDPPDRLLAPGELARIVAPWGWHISVEEGDSREHGHGRGTVHLVARRPA
ncbi:MAG TPA: methyltransferase domain-containing protein [Kofleriaceae bacterium]|nr:methyltransferase domain-containing protein [Kofleriaceae bacterium]